VNALEAQESNHAKLVVRMEAPETENKLLKEKKGLVSV
jgi:hypothetical protein